ncbi:hypothetical protein Syun_002146 [Stephania yunnanensis]|uniref:Uncharacterized protein n=1 Tax=Stephania yunnanensis TaxID=152371 RepID=A0AAP0QBK3_9MAGN
MNLRLMQTMKKMSSHRHQTMGRGNPEDEDVEDINRRQKETSSTTGRDTLSHHATPTHPDGRYSLHYTHGWSHVTRPYPTYAPGPSSSHYTSSSPPCHPYPYQHGTPSPPVHTLPPQLGFIPSSSHHSTPSPPADVYPHDHGIRPSSSHHATPSPSGHPAHSPGVGDEHNSTSRRPPKHHIGIHSRGHPIARLRSSIPQPFEEIPDFFRPLTAPADVENPLTYLIAEHGLYVFFTWDLPMSFAIYDAWCRRAVIRYTGNIYLIAKKRIAHVYLTEEVFDHYKRMRATYEAFKKKSEQMSNNRKSELGGPGTGISLLNAGSISARQHGDTLEKKLQRRPTWKEMFRHLHTHSHDGQSFVDQRSAKIDTPDTSIDEDAVYLEVVQEVKGRVYGLGSQGYHRSISSGGASSPYVPPTPRTPPSPGTERSGPQSDDHPGHLTTEITPSQSGHPHDHRSGHFISPHRRMSEDQRHLLDDHDEFMEQLMPPPRPPPRQE